LRKQNSSQIDKTFSFANASKTIHYQVRYSPHRRTIQIKIEKPGKVIVTAPASISDKELMEAVWKKSRWVTSKLTQMQSAQMQFLSQNLASGESVFYLGQNYQLDLQVSRSRSNPEITVGLEQFHVVCQSDSPDYLRALIITWYRERAADKIEERIRFYAPKLGVMPKAVRIKDHKQRWGSCTSSGNLYFNWRCILAPETIVDYIVVHELCHLLVLNHSPGFWSLVGKIMPDYASRRKWLRENSIRLDF
jgi:predicted metal-dependent hydrolase